MRLVFLIGMLLGLNGSLCANVTLPGFLTDHMVIQRDRPVHIWGMADPGETVTVQFRGNHASIHADILGRWSLHLPQGNAGGPFSLTIQGNNTIVWNDVLVGDVWIAAGQSNMEFQLAKTEWDNSGVQNWQQIVAKANAQNLRLVSIGKRYADYPMSDVATSSWSVCTPATASHFSAVAYFFGREILAHENIPIGIVEADWGGTPAEAWTSLDALSTDARLMPVFAAHAKMMDHEETWALQTEVATKAAQVAKTQGKTQPSIPWHPDPESWPPSALYNAMIAPLLPMPIGGVIWYQGESNTDAMRAPVYARLFLAMIQDWRANWAQGDFPFLFTQIANFTSADAWPTVREAQREALTLPNTGMAVTIDIGDAYNIHPEDKQDVGYRLALLARDISYGEHIEDSGPLFEKATPEHGRMRMWFNHAEGGFAVHGTSLRGFEVAGANGKFYPAYAKVDGDSIIAFSASVARPMYVRYGWASNTNRSLYNHDGLPASPFTSIGSSKTFQPTTEFAKVRP